MLSFGVLFAQPPAGKRYALLVGVKEYRHPKLQPLRYTENDVVQLSDLLRGASYDVVVLCDSTGARIKEHQPTLEAIRGQLKTLLAKCEKGDTVLLGLAGHGVQFETSDDSFFCPSDAKPFPDETQTLLSLKHVYQELDKSNAGVKLLLVDACRDDPTLGRGGRRGIDGDNAPRPPEGVVALFSCRKGQVAYEHKKYQHGIFFHHVLGGLRGQARNGRGEVTWDALQAYVREQVSLEVPELIGEGARQEPNLMGNIAGRPPVLLALKDGAGKPDLARTEIVPLAGASEISNSIQMKLVRIKAGKFKRGSPENEEGRQPDEVRHEVTLTKDLYLGKYLVTQEQYEAIMEVNPSHFCAAGAGRDKVRNVDTSAFPVESVTWDEAMKFCDRLTAREKGLGRAYRLPTEAEWEYACRAGTTTPFWCGEALNGTRANCMGLSPNGTSATGPIARRTSRVDAFKANGWGLCDMHGNLWQWCSDWYGPYDLEKATDPRGPTGGSTRVLRGGSWLNYPKDCRAARRMDFEPGFSNARAGFRVAFTAPAP